MEGNFSLSKRKRMDLMTSMMNMEWEVLKERWINLEKVVGKVGNIKGEIMWEGSLRVWKIKSMIMGSLIGEIGDRILILNRINSPNLWINNHPLTEFKSNNGRHQIDMINWTKSSKRNGISSKGIKEKITSMMRMNSKLKMSLYGLMRLSSFFINYW